MMNILNMQFIHFEHVFLVLGMYVLSEFEYIYNELNYVKSICLKLWVTNQHVFKKYILLILSAIKIKLQKISTN